MLAGIMEKCIAFLSENIDQGLVHVESITVLLNQILLTGNPHFHIHPSSSSSSMMNSYKQPVSFLSPKPLQPRISSSGPYARPSPTAVVLPRVMEKTATIKQEFEPRPG